MDIFDISERVRAKRKELGMSQTRLAERTGLGRVRINQLETGNALDMKFSNIVAILEELGMSVRIVDAPDRRPVFEEIREEMENETPGMD
ncbi:helix-turn-helix domain-containing protein [Pseudosulfitobacter pseudonitzschiae]|uniref:helix-turn-helix domain-containing protein n=1 Tax=Pseudosulfitobacter pseudonitzschiae TaxID=1402135 RepID=UPI003B7D43A6